MGFGYYRFVTDKAESRAPSYKCQHLHLPRFSNICLQRKYSFSQKQIYASVLEKIMQGREMKSRSHI